MRKFTWCFSLLAVSLHAEELKLEQAIQLALDHNRDIANSALDVSIAGARLSALHTKMFPSFSLTVFGAMPLQPVDFTIARGTLGNFASTGPLPDTDVHFRTARRPTGLFLGRVSQPLSTLYRIRLNLKMLDLSKQLAQEQTRGKRQDVVRDVKELYYGIQQVESSLRAVRETVKLYQEVEHLTAEYVAKQTALEGDHLEAETRLASAEENELSLSNQQATQKEQLNQLLGREVLTEFTVAEIEAAADFQNDLAAARQRALDQRPELRQARLQVERARQDLRAKRSEYIPDVSADFNSVGLLAFDSFLPGQFTGVGVTVSWEPFDWGRKKHESAEKRYAISQTENTELDLRNKVLIDVNDKYRQVAQARSQFRVAQLSQKTALENLRVVKKKLEQQAVLLKDVLQAQANLEQSNSNYQQAVAKYWTARAGFEHALGEEK